MFLIGSLFSDLKATGAMTSNAPIAVFSADGTATGATIDCLGYDRVLLTFFSGTLTTGTFTWGIYHGASSDMSDEAAVSSTDIKGTIPAWAATDDNAVTTVEVICRKRYLRVKCVGASTAVGTVGCVALRAAPAHAPVTT
jgi:hypothetical protein